MGNDGPLAPLEDACTVVLLRDGAAGLEVLMLERPGASSAFAGAWVFPGGKVDEADRVEPDGAALDEVAAAQAAGLREVAEETGLRLDLLDLVQLSLWTPMQRLPRRFRTWFLIAEAPSGAVVLNPGEHDDYSWLAPAEALARHGAGTMVLAPPTWVTLYHLSKFSTVKEALTQAAALTPFSYESHFLPRDTGGGPASAPPDGIVWGGDESHPQPSTPGARHRITMTKLPWVFESTVEH
ncbi:NUDIX hydrolase [Arthrobacter sp. GMC3]|uniref:NUDIX hydrolase n=1 Tax=Arthrobacter sp. GMC3 TaxID=2058894 RepID=UPI000CE4FE7C|nr:NUDIX hydrolase [Arthrobacter sp. GMC3]